MGLSSNFLCLFRPVLWNWSYKLKVKTWTSFVSWLALLLGRCPMLRSLSYPAQAHLIMNIVTFRIMNTTSHRHNNRHSDESTPSTEAPSDERSSDMEKCRQIHLSPDYVPLWIEKMISCCPPALLAVNNNQQSLLNISKRSVKEATLSQHSINLDRKL